MKINNYHDFELLSSRLKSEAKHALLIQVAYATCGITAGAKPVFDTLEETLLQHNIKNATLKKTGCLGACYAEPTVLVTKNGEETLFGFVDENRAREIVSKFIVNDEKIEGVI